MIGKYERELRQLENEMDSIPRSLTEIKTRGRKIRSCQKKVREESSRFELARRACLKLPKDYSLYRAHGKYRDKYARPEVQEIHDAIKKLTWARDSLRRAVDAYNDRYTERKELKRRLKELPGYLEEAKAMADIEAKRKAERQAKEKPAKDWKEQWQEVAPGLVVPAKKIKAYLKTFDGDYPVTLNKETTSVKDNVFTLRPWLNRNTFLRLPCYTWEQAERCA